MNNSEYVHPTPEVYADQAYAQASANIDEYRDRVDKYRARVDQYQQTLISYWRSIRNKYEI